MDEHDNHTWSTNGVDPHEDFSTFLDFHDVSLAFAEEDGAGQIAIPENSHNDTMDLADDFGSGLITSQLSTPVSSTYTPIGPMADISAQQSVYNGQAQSRHTTPRSDAPISQRNGGAMSQNLNYRHGMIPDTPTSTEMHGVQIHAFTDPQALSAYEADKHQDQMIFTPLVSPAFQLHDFAAVPEYFSPLTSPAIQAQDYSMVKSFQTNTETEVRDRNTTTATGKGTKRRSTVNGKNPVHTIRSSPAMKARQKRQSGSTKTPKELNEISNGLTASVAASPSLAAGNRVSTLQSQSNSETGSISPEPLSDVLMPPPAAPRASSSKTSRSSPNERNSQNLADTTRATPASLFKISKPAPGSGNDMFDGKTLSKAPSAHNSEQKTKHSVDTTAKDSVVQAATSASTPQHEINETINTAFTTAANSEESSPQGESGLPSPLIVREQSGAQKAPRKRGSSTQISPALLPRISPSIKPLLPGSLTLNSEATANLLANKSNYERIIDGSASHLGVNFPAQLSENLTSKRTSHKLAEQGRRNRINTALAEIQALLPDNFVKDSQESSASNATSSTINNASTSKAKTVEDAITFIKQLQAELATTKSELAVAREKLDEATSQKQQ